MLERSGGAASYHEVRQASEDQAVEKGITDPNEHAKRCWPWKPAACVFLLILVGLVGHTSGVMRERARRTVEKMSGTAPRVPVDFSQEVFVYNGTLLSPPPAAGRSEPTWDALIPNGLGYVKDTPLTPSISMISVFHQLHCLYTIRRAYYSTIQNGSLEDFDFGVDRTMHAEHCFEYLTQSILCAADSTLEPAGRDVHGFLGQGLQRQCRSFKQVKSWAERWRAFDARGFLAEMENGR